MFNISLSGLTAAQKYLDTTSNNLANANTYGFKYSRAEFGDVYGSTIYTNTTTATGMGVYTTTVSQQFTQGTLSGDTGNNLDLAIEGDGFFVLSSTCNTGDGTSSVGDRTYTRNGAFELDSEGYIVTSTGEYLQGYTLNDDGTVANLDLSATIAIQIPSSTGAPQESTEASIGVNLPASADSLGTDEIYAYEQFDPEDSSTYTASTSQTIYDSLGNSHTLTYYFLKDRTNDGTEDTADPDTGETNDDGSTVWYVIIYVDGEPVDVADIDSDDDGTADIIGYDDDGNAIYDEATEMTVTEQNSSAYGETFYGITLVFDTSGELESMIPDPLYLSNEEATFGTQEDTEITVGGSSVERDASDYTLSVAMGGGVSTSQSLHISLDLTQYGSSSFTVSTTPSTDGYSTGTLTNVSVDEDGIVYAEYSNGETVAIAMIAMATFVNEQGLTKVGDTQWAASSASGEAIASQAGVGTCGNIVGSNLELSNVDMTSELVDLIIAQRTYQANSQALQTQNTVMDSILSIR